MNVSIFLVLCVLLVSFGVNKANEETKKDSGHIQRLVKRVPACGYKSCSYRACCYGYSCVSGFCKVCAGRNCYSKNDCCNGYTCSYKKCIRRKTGGGGRVGGGGRGGNGGGGGRGGGGGPNIHLPL